MPVFPWNLDNEKKEYRYAESNFIQFVREYKGADAAQKASAAQGINRN